MHLFRRSALAGIMIGAFRSASAHFIELIVSTPRTAFTNGAGYRAFTLSNQNLTATSGSGYFNSVFASNPKASGKWYAEIKIPVLSTNTAVGIAAPDFYTYDDLGAQFASVGYYPVSPATAIYFNNVQITGGSVSDTNGAVVRIAVDVGMKMIWFSSPAMTGVGNKWNNSAIANPATGVGGVSFIGINTGPYYLAVNAHEAGNVFTINTIPPFTGAVPAGFRPWN